MTVPYVRDVLVEVLIYHQRRNMQFCTCGWGKLGASHPEHVADVYEMTVDEGRELSHVDPRQFVLNAERDYTHTFIQWKGTDVCFDFECECGWGGHFDGFFAYAVECGGCGKTWEMPQILIPKEGFGNGCVVKPTGDS